MKSAEGLCFYFQQSHAQKICSPTLFPSFPTQPSPPNHSGPLRRALFAISPMLPAQKTITQPQ